MTEKTDNLALGFLEAAEKFKLKTLLKYETGSDEKPGLLEENSLSYGEFIKRAISLAASLRQAGFSSGTRVGLLVPSGPQWCLAFVAAILAGAIAVPINEAAPESDIKAILADCRPGALFVDNETKKSRLYPPGENTGTINLDSPEFSIKKEVPENERGVLLALPSTETDEPAAIIYTSGTTGVQKGVTLTHKNLISDAQAIIETGIVGERENLLMPLPFYHAYPLMCFIASFLSGASLTLLASTKELARVAKKRGATIIVAVPQMLELLNSSLKNRLPDKKLLAPLLPFCGVVRRNTGINLGKTVFGKIHSALGGGLRLIASGGARLAPEVMRDLESFGFTVVEGYGLTETSPVVTFNPVDKRKPGSAGRPVRGARVRIENGEVLLSGPMLMQGYWMKPEETGRAVVDGWLHTGDSGWMDDEGYLYITGRKKELIVLSSGKNISPEEVEKRYGESSLIKEIAVYEERGVLKGVIVPGFDYAREKGIANLREELGWELMRLGQGMPSYMRLTGFSLVKGPLPKTPLGKIKRYQLGELLKKKSAAAETKETDPKFLGGNGEKIARALNLAAGRKTRATVRAEDNLELDIGLDSLKRIELLAALEEEFYIKTLPEDFLLDVQTAGELLQKIEGFLSLPASPASGEEKKKPAGAVDERGRDRFLSLLLYCLIKGLAKVLFRVKSEGRPLPAAPFILAPNHSSFLDAFIITAALPGKTAKTLFFVGWERYFRGVVARTLRVIHVIPLDREHLLGRALRNLAEVLRQGYALCVFPEGGRSFDGKLMELKPGIAAMAINEGVPIVPVWIDGAAKALPRGARMIKPVRIRVRFGRPLYPGDFERDGEKLLRALAENLNALSRGAERS